MTLRLALLDRDGTLNRKPPEGDYVTEPDGLVLLAGAAEGVRRLNEAGVAVAVVTNQRCVGLGIIAEARLEDIHARLKKLLAATGAHIDAIFYCPHHDGTCDCRKPAPGMLIAAAARFGAEPGDTVMIGD